MILKATVEETKTARVLKGRGRRYVQWSVDSVEGVPSVLDGCGRETRCAFQRH
jgi:hypothetical protein